MNQARNVLLKMWNEPNLPTPKLPAQVAQDIRHFFDFTHVKTGVKSLRYALLTQSLAVYVCPDIDALALQAGASVGPGRIAIDARSFCKKVIVPFEREYLSGILGASQDPYVSKPLRRPRIDPEAPVKNRSAWKALYRVLAYINEPTDAEARRARAEEVLLAIFHKLRSTFHKISPPADLSKREIPLERLLDLVRAFLHEQSDLGARPQYTVYAFLRAFNEIAKVYGRLEVSKATEADEARRRLGDIVIYDQRGKVKLVLSVTHWLDEHKLQEEVDKARQHGIREMVVVATRIELPETYSADEEWPEVVWYTVDAFFRPLILAVDADIRHRFVEAIMYKVLREFGEIPMLQRWDELVRRHFLK